jgi:hypothetical protein
MNRKFKNIAVHLDLKEQIEFIAEILGISQNEALKRIINPICETLAIYKKGANMTVSDSILSGSVTFKFSGRRNLIVGHFEAPTTMSDADVDKKIKTELEKVIKNG